MKAFKALMCFVCEWPVDWVVEFSCLLLHQSTGKFTSKKAAPIVPHRPHPAPVHPRTTEARLLDGLLAFVIVMRPSWGQRCQRYDSQTCSACLSLFVSETLPYPCPSFLQSRSCFLSKLSVLFECAEVLHLAFFSPLLSLQRNSLIWAACMHL